MINPVLDVLARARLQAAPVFARWCEHESAAFCPAAPAVVARFVRDCAGVGIASLWAALQDVSRLHESKGLADPTASSAVSAAVNEISGIVPPRSWPAERKQRFKALPYDMQAFIVQHETARDRALRRAQNEAADARHKLAALSSTRTADERSASHESSPQRPATRGADQDHPRRD